LLSNVRDQYPLGQSEALKNIETLKQDYELALHAEADQPSSAILNYKQILNQHPSIAEVYFRLGKISEQNILILTYPTSPDSFLLVMPFTEHDRRIGELKILNLIDDFPFNGRTIFNPDPPINDQVDIIAKTHVYAGLYWDAAHFELVIISPNQEIDSRP